MNKTHKQLSLEWQIGFVVEPSKCFRGWRGYATLPRIKIVPIRIITNYHCSRKKIKKRI